MRRRTKTILIVAVSNALIWPCVLFGLVAALAWMTPRKNSFSAMASHIIHHLIFLTAMYYLVFWTLLLADRKLMVAATLLMMRHWYLGVLLAIPLLVIAAGAVWMN